MKNNFIVHAVMRSGDAWAYYFDTIADANACADAVEADGHDATVVDRAAQIRNSRPTLGIW